MSWTGCDETAYWLTWALQQDAVRGRASAAVQRHASAPELIEAMILDLEPSIQERVRMGLGELPAAAVLGILAAWQTADTGGVPFVFESLRPESPIDLARRRSVRLVIDVDEAGVHAGLSHIPTRHPTWAEGAG